MDMPAPTPPARSRTGALLGIGIALIVLALIGLAALFIPRLLETGAAAQGVTAVGMPADTQVYLSFNPHFDKLPNGDIVLKAWNDPEIAQSLEGAVRDALQDSDLDWDRDVAPWLGDEVGLGMWNLSPDTLSKAASPSFAVVISTRDPAKTNAALARWRAALESKGQTFNEQPYRDIATVEQTAGASIAYATVKEFVVFATGPDDLHAVIDATLDGKGLDQEAPYRNMLGRLRGNRALTAYIDLSGFLKPILQRLETEGGAALNGLNRQAIDQIMAAQSAAMGVTFEPNGILIEFIAQVDVNQLSEEARQQLDRSPNTNRLLGAVPDSTFVYLGSEITPDTLRQIEADPTYAALIDSVESETKIDLKEDVFSWIAGELALVAMPGSGLGAQPSQLPFGLAFILAVDDTQLAEAKSSVLFHKLAEQSDATIEDVTIGDASLHVMKDSRSDQPILLYGLIDGKFVLTLSESTARKIAGASEKPLANDATFKAATALLPRSNSGYGYIKPKTIVDLLSLGLSFSGQSCTACPLIDPVKAVAFAGEQPAAEPGLGRNVFFLLLNTGDR